MNRQLAGERVSRTGSTEHDTVDSPGMSCTDQLRRDRPLLDSRLIVQIGQQDEQALGTLYDRYGALVYTIAMQITQDRALAETIVQDTFQAVWQSASSFQIGASVPMWLIGMARQRASEAAQPRSSRMRTHRAAQPAKHTIHDKKQSERIADARHVHPLLDTLPADQRETLELAYYYGLTCSEIAVRLHKPVGVIKTYLRKGLCALAEGLGNSAAHLGEQNL